MLRTAVPARFSHGDYSLLSIRALIVPGNLRLSILYQPLRHRQVLKTSQADLFASSLPVRDGGTMLPFMTALKVTRDNLPRMMEL